MLSQKEWKDLCLLARLDPKDKSLAGLMDDFNKILSYVETIQEVDTSAVEDSYNKGDTRNVVRDDECLLPLDPSEIAQVAPLWQSGHFVVPAVIDAE